MESWNKFQAIVIKKTQNQIEEDMKRILCMEKPASGCEIQMLWAYFLDLTVEPVGWNAIWKMSRDTCLQFGVEFPTLAIVMVKNVIYEELSADVTVTCVDENAADILPDQIKDIPLIQLYPTVAQENNFLDVERTADSLESLRLFYRYLWYPWDDEDDSSSWVLDHLDNRLKLHFDMMSRRVPQNVISKINNLIEKGKHIHNNIKEILDSSKNDEHENSENDVVLCQLNVELNYIQENLNMLENKYIRDKTELSSQGIVDSTPKLDDEPSQIQHVFLAWLDGVTDDLLNVLQRIKSNLNNKNSFSCLPSLEKLFNEWLPKNIIYVGAGTHYLKRNCFISSEGTVEGIGEVAKTIIQNSEGALSLLEIASRVASINNLTFFGSKVKFIIVVRCGRCEISNVAINGSNKKQFAVVVHSGAEFYAENCTFTECYIAVKANEGSKITLKNCVFNNNVNGLAFQSSQVHLENCQFKDHVNSAVSQVASDDLLSQNNGRLEMGLESLPGVTTKGVMFTNNKINVLKSD